MGFFVCVLHHILKKQTIKALSLMVVSGSKFYLVGRWYVFKFLTLYSEITEQKSGILTKHQVLTELIMYIYCR